jgi:hypothetical protein
MKKSFYSNLLGFLFIILALNGCKTLELVEIYPEKDPSLFSRSLLVKGGTNCIGEAPTSNETSELIISKSQPTATVATDNYLFVPFLAAFSNDAQGVYLQVEGADNYWEIPISNNSLKSASTSLTEVLSIGIPENIQAGIFNIYYKLFSSDGKIGNTAMLEAKVVFPVDYCEKGAQIGTVKGEDGISAQTYTLGDTPGFVEIQYETYSIPDRLDIRYNNHWIRSTGDLLGNGNDAPPIKVCDDVVSGDGFLGTSGSFHIFYDPSISKKLDVYVSGCLDGGTAWDYNIVDCPKDKPIIGIHSNADPSNGIDSGHAWISLTQNGITHLYGLWPDFNPKVENNGNKTDIRVDIETGFGKYSRFLPIDEDQLNRLKYKLGQNKTWTATYNCSSWAQEVYKYVTNESISADEFFNGSPLETPRKLSEGIMKLESTYPTSNFKPEGIGEDSSSCSFCK